MNTLSWTDVANHLTEIVAEMQRNNEAFDCVVAVSRGGFIPAYRLATQLGIARLTAIGVRYEDESRTSLDLYAYPTFSTSFRQVLLVEDQIESGKVMNRAKKELEKRGSSVTTCAIFVSHDSIFSFDYFCSRIKEPVQFPWEERNW